MAGTVPDLAGPGRSPLSLGRERSRSHLLLVGCLVVAVSLLLPQQVDVHAPIALAAVSAAAVTVLAAAFRPRWPALNQLAAVLVAAETFALVMATGGPRSAYAGLYAVLLIYAAMFYGTRRLLLLSGVVAVLAFVPYVVASGSGIEPERTEMLVRFSLWIGSAAVVHLLVLQVRAATETLRQKEQWYRSLFDQNPDAVFSFDRDGHFTSVNPAASRLVASSVEEMVGTGFERFVAPDDLAQTQAHFSAALEGEPQRYEITVVDREARHVPVAVSNVPIVIGDRIVGVHGVAKDVSELKALQRDLADQALHDQLTGLANRRLLADRVERALADTRRSRQQVSLLLLDLDGFKPVNDTLGHAAGDLLLVEIGSRLCRCVRPGDTVSRIGGDEFVLVLPACPPEEAEKVAERLLREIAAPVTLRERRVSVSASVGIAVSGDAAADPDQLLREADDAMYAAKRAGRNQYRFFDPNARPPGPDRLTGVPTADSRAWAAYVGNLRAEIAERQQRAELPHNLRAPHTAYRTLEELLGAIDDLPEDEEVGDLVLPDREALEEFVYHHTAVQHWADALVRDGLLVTSRPMVADRFWALLTAAVQAGGRRSGPHLVATVSSA